MQAARACRCAVQLLFVWQEVVCPLHKQAELSVLQAPEIVPQVETAAQVPFLANAPAPGTQTRLSAQEGAIGVAYIVAQGPPACEV